MRIIVRLKYKLTSLNYVITILRAYLSKKTSLSKSLLLSKKDGFELDPIGMTDLNEQKLFYFSTYKLYTGQANIVDLGCWLGSTTEQLASGLKRNKQAFNGFELTAIDRFIWEDWMTYPHLEYLTKDLVLGDNFQDIFIEKVVKKYPFVVSVKADLLEYIYSGKLIEILLIDVMKTIPLVNAVTKSFCSCVIEGGYIIHQDFAHEWTPWIHIHLFENKDLLDFKYYAIESGSAIFQVKGKTFKNIKSLSEYDTDTLEIIFNDSIKKITNIYHQDKVRCAFIFSLLWSDRKVIAKEKLDQYFKKGYSEYGPLKNALVELEK